MDNAPSTELPNAWVERLFERLLAMYGRKFADMWGCVEIASLKATWARALGDLSHEEIASGLTRCLDREWPPTLPEFRALCRRQSSADTAFLEAVKRYPSREGWSEPAIYWAAAAIGAYDLRRLPYTALRARWVDALDEARQSRRPIPEPVPAERQLENADADPERVKAAAERVLSQWRNRLKSAA